MQTVENIYGIVSTFAPCLRRSCSGLYAIFSKWLLRFKSGRQLIEDNPRQGRIVSHGQKINDVVRAKELSKDIGISTAL